MTALLRPATANDISEVVRIERACFADPWSEEAFRRLLGGPPAIFLVAVFPPHQTLAGYVIAFSVDADAEILNLAVEPNYRSKGLAGQMLDAAVIELANRGVVNAYLEVRESNAPARALYAARGFGEIGRRRSYYRRPVEDALVLRRVIGTEGGEEQQSTGSFADR
jgi:ribosomal-protein-alanine N-acetyltransferase